MTKEYIEYLQTAHWKSTRAIIIYARGNKCENCGSGRRLQVHHLNYDNLWHETDKDLKVLCEWCHSRIFHAENQTAEFVSRIIAFLAESKRWKHKEIEDDKKV